MRTYGRQRQTDGTRRWVQIDTTADGFNDAVYLTTLIQCLLLNLGESPFWANYGIPARQSVLQGVPPDFAVAFIQQRFANYFASLTITKVRNIPPTYNVSVVTHVGYKLTVNIEVPR